MCVGALTKSNYVRRNARHLHVNTAAKHLFGLILSLRVYVYVCVHDCQCMYACVCVCVRVSECLCASVRLQIYPLMDDTRINRMCVCCSTGETAGCRCCCLPLNHLSLLHHAAQLPRG